MGNINWKSPPAVCMLTEKLKTIPLSLVANNLCNGADDCRAPRETDTPKLCQVACSCWQIKRTNSFAIWSSMSVGSRDSSLGSPLPPSRRSTIGNSSMESICNNAISPWFPIFNETRYELPAFSRNVRQSVCSDDRSAVSDATPSRSRSASLSAPGESLDG